MLFISSKSNKARYDFAEQIYKACLEGNEIAGQAIASKNATWLSILREAIRNTMEIDVTAQEWIRGINTEMAEAGIQWVPGCHRKRLTSRRVIQLDGAHPRVRPILKLAGPEGSLKRAAMEAEQRMAMEERAPKKRKKRIIDLGAEIPFTRVPKVVQEGFDKLVKSHQKTDPELIRHLRLAHSCLVQCLGDPLCDLMLMLALTFAACTTTPSIEMGETEFRPAQRQRDADMLAATMVTRMLWFMRPKEFPWEEEMRGVLPIKKITPKIGESN